MLTLSRFQYILAALGILHALCVHTSVSVIRIDLVRIEYVQCVMSDVL
jgi:hypothetical protein